jgi:hypothetical protein
MMLFLLDGYMSGMYEQKTDARYPDIGPGRILPVRD